MAWQIRRRVAFPFLAFDRRLRPTSPALAGRVSLAAFLLMGFFCTGVNHGPPAVAVKVLLAGTPAPLHLDSPGVGRGESSGC
jgi:hypothetical protein